jgi:hypothetical protein
MKLQRKMMIRNGAVSIALDALIAYAATRLLSPEDGFAFWVYLAILWGIAAAMGLRKWLYRVAALWLGNADLVEAYRRRYVETNIPAPPMYELTAETYLTSVAEDQEQPELIRFSALALALEMPQAQAWAGPTTALWVRGAMDAALNKLRI